MAPRRTLSHLPVNHLVRLRDGFGTETSEPATNPITPSLFTRIGTSNLSPLCLQAGLNHLKARNEDLLALQILSQEETDPQWAGDVALVDCENESETDVSVSDRMLQRYRDALRAMQQQLRQQMTGFGRYYLPLTAGAEISDFLSYGKRYGFLG